MKNIKEKGITLIALVITIIILLILAGVSVAMLTGKNGIIQQAINAKEKTEIAIVQEKVDLWLGENNMYSSSKKVSKPKTEKEFLEQLIIEDENIEKENIDKQNKVININGEKISYMISEGTKSGVNILDIYDSTGVDNTKLQIGDFVNYYAGDWTQEELDATSGIQISNGRIIGGADNFVYSNAKYNVLEGQSRDENATVTNDTKTFAKEEDGNDISGWRIFDISEEGTITLISAGNPENIGCGYGYENEYIWTGKTSQECLDGLGITSFEDNYNKRKWDMYENIMAKEDSARMLLKEDISNWFSKYMEGININHAGYNLNPLTGEIEYIRNYFKIYGTKNQSMIDNHSTFMLGSRDDAKRFSYYQSWGRNNENILGIITPGYNFTAGVRVILELKDDIKILEEPVGTKTIINPVEGLIDNEYNEKATFNVWDIYI